MVISKLLSKSNVSFMLVCAVVSLFYLVTGAFGGDDVTQSTRVFGAAQLFILLFVSLFMAWMNDRPKFIFKCGFYFFFLLLLFIQILPAYYWIWFNGLNAFPNTQEGLGITAHWYYGAIHVGLIIWGFVNIVTLAVTQHRNYDKNTTIRNPVPCLD